MMQCEKILCEDRKKIIFSRRDKLFPVRKPLIRTVMRKKYLFFLLLREENRNNPLK